VQTGEESGTLLDLDWSDLSLEVAGNAETKRRLSEILAYDLEWLRRRQLMDYSLLVGVRKPDGKRTTALNMEAGVIFSHFHAFY